MADKRVSRKELLNEPDEFITTFGKVVDYVRNHPRATALIGVAFVACVIAGVLVYSYVQHREIVSHERFEEAYREFRAVIQTGETADEKKLQELLVEFDRIVEDYGSLVAGEMALLYSGHVLYKMKDYKRALERYQRMKSTQLVENGLASLVMYHMAMTHLALRDYEAAKTLFEKLAEITDSPYRREAYSSVAAIYEAMGKQKEAVQAYRQYLKMFPRAPDAAYVKSRISDLSGRG